MSDLWMPEAEHIPGPRSAGGQMQGGGFLLTHHITTGNADYVELRHYLVEIGFEPTVLLDPWDGHRGQFLPADRSGFALKHPAGMPETNREGKIHIQVEWVCKDMNTDLSTAPYFAEQWHALCVWSHGLGVPYKWTFGGALATSRDPQTWKRSGHRGHRNAPGNDHVDSLPANQHPWPSSTPHVTPPKPTPTPVEEDTVKLIQTPGDLKVFVTDFVTKRHVTNPAELAVVQPLLTDRTIHQVPAAVRDAIPTVGSN